MNRKRSTKVMRVVGAAGFCVGVLAATASPVGASPQARETRRPASGRLFTHGHAVRSIPLFTYDHTYTVNNNSNTDDAATSDGTCSDSAGHCTLRAAIEQADVAGGADLINFHIGSAPQTIRAAGGFPAVTTQITIDGTTQPGYDTTYGYPAISLEGAGAGSGINGLTLRSSNDQVIGLEIGDYTDGDGIDIENYSGAVVAGTYIGIDRTGTHLRPNTTGIYIDGDNDTVTSTSAGMVNVVSGNTYAQVNVGYVTGASISGIYAGTTPDGSTAIGGGQYGIAVLGTGVVGAPGQNTLVSGVSTGVLLYGSDDELQDAFIGTNLAGTAAIPNGYGVSVGGSCSGTVTGNLISGNSDAGVTGCGLDVWGNWIGTDITGAQGLGNYIGVSGQGFIGPNDPESQTDNVISGNQIGVAITGNSTVTNNYIGTDAAGSSGVANATGMQVSGLTNNIDNDLISANTGDGIDIQSASRFNQIEGNIIGSDLYGNPLGNGSNGVYVNAGSSTDEVGDMGLSLPNDVVFNGAAGVAVASGTGFSIEGNSITGNGGLGIDLGATGVTPNDAGDSDAGANDLQNYPVLTKASGGSSTTTIAGTLTSTPSDSYTIDFYESPACDSSGSGEGWSWLGSETVDTDSSGTAGVTLTVPSGWAPPHAVITATATDSNGSTSEFSTCRSVTGSVADVQLSLTANSSSVAAGGTVTYTATITNAGPDAARTVTLTNNNRSTNTGGVVETVASSQGTCTQPTAAIAKCALGSLDVGASATVTIKVTYGKSGRFLDKGSVVEKSYDPDGSNNAALVRTAVTS